MKQQRAQFLSAPTGKMIKFRSHGGMKTVKKLKLKEKEQKEHSRGIKPYLIRLRIEDVMQYARRHSKKQGKPHGLIMSPQ